MMTHYQKIKAKYPNALMLFRVGTFYEALEKDAEICSNVLELVLCKRITPPSKKVVSLTSFPHNNLELYLPKLVRAGHKVAICDALENPNQQKPFVPDW